MFLYLQNWGSDFSCVDLAPSDTVPTSGETSQPSLHYQQTSIRDSTPSFIYSQMKNKNHCIGTMSGVYLVLQQVESRSYLLSVVHKLRPADINVVAALGDFSTVSVATMKSNFPNLSNKRQFYFFTFFYTVCVLKAPTVKLLTWCH